MAQRLPYLAAHVGLTPGVLWCSGGVLATLVNGEFFGIALNVVVTLATMALALYEGITGIRKALPFSILILGCIGTIISVIVEISGQAGTPGLQAVGYLVALLFWTFGHACVMLRTNIQKFADYKILNPLVYYNTGNILSVLITPLASVCFAAGIVRACVSDAVLRGRIKTIYQTITPERWAGFGYWLAALLSISAAPVMAGAFFLWGSGYFCLERDRNLAAIGLRMPDAAS